MTVVSVVGITLLLANFDLNIKNVKSDADQLAIYAALVLVLILVYAVAWAIIRAYRT